MANKKAQQQAWMIAYWAIYILVVVAALNWGLVALSDGKFNLVNMVSFENPMIEKGLYIIVGAAGLGAIALAFSKKQNPCNFNKK